MKTTVAAKKAGKSAKAELFRDAIEVFRQYNKYEIEDEDFKVRVAELINRYSQLYRMTEDELGMFRQEFEERFKEFKSDGAGSAGLMSPTSGESFVLMFDPSNAADEVQA